MALAPKYVLGHSTPTKAGFVTSGTRSRERDIKRREGIREWRKEGRRRITGEERIEQRDKVPYRDFFSHFQPALCVQQAALIAVSVVYDRHDSVERESAVSNCGATWRLSQRTRLHNDNDNNSDDNIAVL